MNNDKIVNIEITKKRVIQRVDNSMTSYRNYAVYFRAYIDDRRYYRRVDVVTIYDDDIFEYAEKDHLSKKEYNRVINELVWGNISYYEGMNIKSINAVCNQHIDTYNQGV